MTTRAGSSIAALPPPGFSALGLDPRIVSALLALGYEEPTPVQREAIPPLLAGRDVLGQAATGTGKTAAFALPLLHILTPTADAKDRLGALILVPTRELAMQVAEAVHKYGKAMGITAVPIYGGSPMETQLRALKRGVDVVVATPGRALDHIRRKSLRLSSIKVVILDEADEMLDMGFAEDLEAILNETPKERQTALFSATLPPRIAEIANKHLKNPVRVRIDREVVPAGTAPRVRQVAYVVGRAHKMATLGRVLDVENPTSAIVFCRTRTEVDELCESLNGRGYRAEALHGGLSQEQRDRVMKKFRANTADLLIATDVAARGLDVELVSHVVNYDVPTSAEAYVHYNPKGSFQPKVVEKDAQTQALIRQLLAQSFLFRHLDASEVAIIVSAMEIRHFKAGDAVIRQNEDGNELYVVGSGQLRCTKLFPDSAEETFLKNYEPGEYFGELALLYNAPRAASITALGNATLYSLDRECFNHIVKESAVRNRNIYEQFLAEVEVLHSLDQYERSKLCDCLKIQIFEPGQRVIRESERGDTFYIIIEGKAQALKINPATGKEEPVWDYKEKMYFGELALLRDEPRAASIVAQVG